MATGGSTSSDRTATAAEVTPAISPLCVLFRLAVVAATDVAAAAAAPVATSPADDGYKTSSSLYLLN